LPFIDNFTNIGGLTAGVAAGLFTISITRHAALHRRFSGLAAGTCGMLFKWCCCCCYCV
jgi:hypothetical protein